MDLSDEGSENSLPWMNATKNSGNDMHGIPIGMNDFNTISFNVIDPAKNNRRAAAAVSLKKGYPKELEIPVNDTAASVYLLHTISDIGANKIAAAITMLYADGTKFSRYIMGEKDVTDWWTVPNALSTKVGVCWAAIDNPNPSKKIQSIIVESSVEGGIYAILGISLSNQAHYIAPKGESYGGPDNWAAANGLSALVEGLAGVKNTGIAFSEAKISPRWSSAGVDSVAVTVNLAASNEYISYIYTNQTEEKAIHLKITGSADSISTHVLLPPDSKNVKSVVINGKPIAYSLSAIETSNYVDINFELKTITQIEISYE
jgi:hypothetical protein